MSKAYEVVGRFERTLAEYTGFNHVVSVDSCSNALFLCLYYKSLNGQVISIPNKTYPSVANAIIHVGAKIKFVPFYWQSKGYYQLGETGIWDSAKYLCKGMRYEFDNEALVCLSFHGKKCLKIGRGGAILTNHIEDAEWFRIARFDGRHARPLPDDELEFTGWNCYLTPEQAARGLELMQWLPERNLTEPDEYQDLSKYDFYK